MTRQRSKILRKSVCAIVILFLVACGQEQSTEKSPGEATAPQDLAKLTPLVIYTVNYPLQYFAERIGGDRVEVVFPAPVEEDPAYWSPTAEEIAAYQGADLILLNGAGYAKWLSLASLPQSRLVDTSASIRDDLIPLEEGPVHTHGPQGEHSHKGTAFTTWLDPDLATEQARAIADAMSGARPEHKEIFEQRFAELETDLRALSSELESFAVEQKGLPLLFSHPVYQYLIGRYDLNAKSIHWEPGEMPSDEQWRELDELIGQHPARWMIWEDVPSQEIIAELGKRGIGSAVFRPCATTPASGDYMAVMRENVEAMKSLERGR